ncbi:MAG: patatin-like phospholipase family protein [Pseudomonadota bacterium]
MRLTNSTAVMLAIFGIIVALGWFFAMAFMQGGSELAWASLLKLLMGAGIVGAIALVKFVGPKYPVMTFTMVLGAIGIVVLWQTGLFHSGPQFAWDMFGIFLGSIFALGLDTLCRIHPQYTSLTDDRFLDGSVTQIGIGFSIQTVMFWVGISAAAVLRPPIAEPNPDRFSEFHASLAVPKAVSAALEDQRIGVALSGGGYRAAVYHTGTLHALEQLGVKPDVLSTVSGGSIIGAYYALGGDPLAFKQEVAVGRFNYYRELSLLHNVVALMGPVTVPWLNVELLPFWQFSRGDLQVGLLDRLVFTGAEHELPAGGAPRLIINTVDTTYGLLLGFTAEGLLIQAPNGRSEYYTGDAYQPVQRFNLAERVAISGAFPLAFPSVAFDLRVHPQGATGDGTRNLKLIDGGVADNTGLEMLAVARSCVEPQSTECFPSAPIDAAYAVDLMFVSDASAIFGIEPDLSSVAGLSRAFDISGARAKRFDPSLSGAHKLDYSAQDHYLSPDQLFRLYRDAHGESDEGPRQTSVQVLPRKHQPDFIIEAMVELLPAYLHPNLRSNFHAMVANAPKPADPEFREWSKRTGRASEYDIARCVSGTHPDPDAMAFCDTVVLIYTLETEITRLLDVFRNVSTLDDQLGHQTVEDLHRLGQMIVYLQWPALVRSLRDN